MRFVVTKLEKAGVIPKPILPVTLVYSTMVTLCSGYLYLYSAWAPQLVNKLQLSPTDAGTLTIMLSVGSAICGLPSGLIIDSWGTEIATACGGVLTMVSYLTIRYCYLNDINNMFVLSTAVGISGFASIIGNYSAMKCATSNFPAHKGAACGVVASGFAVSALVLSGVASKLFRGNVPGLLMFLGCFNGSIIFMGVFFVREIRQGLEYELIDHENQRHHGHGYDQGQDEEEQTEEEEELESIHGASSLMNSPSRTVTSNYHTIEGQNAPNSNNKTNNKTNKNSAEFHETSIHYRSAPVSSGSEISSNLSASFSNAFSSSSWRSLWQKLPFGNSSTYNRGSDSLLKKIFTSRLFLLTALAITFLASVGQTYIFSVGYIVQTQYVNNNYHYGISQHDFQNLQVSVFSLCNFIGRFTSGYLSDLIVKRLHLQRLWIMMLSICLLFVSQVILTRLNDLDHLIVVSLFSGLAFGILFGTYPTIVSDYYQASVYSTVWGSITVGPFFTNTLLSHYFATEIERHGEFNDDLKQFVCYLGVDCYKNTFYLTQLFCLLALVCVLYTIWYKKTVLKERTFI